jgi:hypothetical protein
MLSTVLLTAAVWTCVALVVGVIIGRRLRRRAPQAEAERSEFRHSA